MGLKLAQAIGLLRGGVSPRGDPGCHDAVKAGAVKRDHGLMVSIDVLQKPNQLIVFMTNNSSEKHNQQHSISAIVSGEAEVSPPKKWERYQYLQSLRFAAHFSSAPLRIRGTPMVDSRWSQVSRIEPSRLRPTSMALAAVATGASLQA